MPLVIPTQHVVEYYFKVCTGSGFAHLATQNRMKSLLAYPILFPALCSSVPSMFLPFQSLPPEPQLEIGEPTDSH